MSLPENNIAIQNYLFSEADFRFLIQETKEANITPELQQTCGYFCNGEYDKAYAQLSELYESNRKDARLANGYILAAIACGKPEINKILQDIFAVQQESAQFLYFTGLLYEKDGDYVQAMENYQKAVDKDNTFIPAVFRMAYLSDLHGEEEYAMELYEKSGQNARQYTNIWLNLGTLYEDRGEYPKAVDCYQKILTRDPSNRRAKLFCQDASASLSMHIDEDKDRENNRMDQVLATPISDFELSVRSKNCLNKMKIKTLGDLIKKTETELLSYKNFGETSLAEIKEILTKKGLKLGMGLEEKAIEKKEKKLGKILNMVPSANAPVVPASEITTAPGAANQEMLDMLVSNLELSVRSRKCLVNLNIKTISDLIQRKESELLSCRNFGTTSLLEIKKKLADLGITLCKE